MNGNGGSGAVVILTIVFITLKLTGVITWSWVWVLAPLWISFVIGLALLLGIGLWCHMSKRVR